MSKSIAGMSRVCGFLTSERHLSFYEDNEVLLDIMHCSVFAVKYEVARMGLRPWFSAGKWWLALMRLG